MKLLGIDVGTGGTRAVLVDERGRVVAAATAEHAPFASPQTGWAEQDAKLARSCVRQLSGATAARASSAQPSPNKSARSD
jgi:xylulokinase